MKWFSHVFAWVLLVGLFAFSPVLRADLPTTSEGIAAVDQWAGVLRVWVCLSWQPGSGSLVPWLNEVAARFERSHPGVYVQVTPIRATQLPALSADAVIFSPSLLTDSAGLHPLSGDGDQVYAIPVAMGGYAWAVNAQMLDGLPLWDADLPAPAKGDEPAFVMQAPADGGHLSWSGALSALCMAPPVGDDPPNARNLAPDVDLGLAPEPEPAASPQPARFTVPVRRPPNFRQQDSVLADFIDGRAAAIPVTQVEIRRLEQLASMGRAPDYEIIPAPRAFTDQLALFSIPSAVPEKRRELSEALLDMLLDEDAQLALASVHALRVTLGAPLYPSGPGMRALESGYAGRDVESPGAFESGYINRYKSVFDAALNTFSP